MADVTTPTTETDVGQNIVTIKEIEPVEFTDESAGADNVRWDFGDGNTSTERNPIHNYTTNGEFIVTFTGFNDFGEASIEQTITVSGIGEEIPGIDVIEEEDPIEPDTYDPGEPPTDEEEEDREQEEILEDNPIVQVNLQALPGEFVFEQTGEEYVGPYHLHQNGDRMIRAGTLGVVHELLPEEIIVPVQQQTLEEEKKDEEDEGGEITEEPKRKKNQEIRVRKRTNRTRYSGGY